MNEEADLLIACFYALCLGCLHFALSSYSLRHCSLETPTGSIFRKQTIIKQPLRGKAVGLMAAYKPKRNALVNKYLLKLKLMK